MDEGKLQFKKFARPDLSKWDVKIRTTNLIMDCLDLEDEVVAEVEAELLSVDALNRQIVIHNREARKNWITFLEKLGAKPIKSGGGYYAWFANMLKALGASDGHPANLSDLLHHCSDILNGQKLSIPYFHRKSLVQAVAETRKLRDSAEASNTRQRKEYVKAVQLAPDYGIDPLELDGKTLIHKVTEKKQEEWVKEHYPKGTEMTVNECDYCDTWEVGDRRCSCGNRRVYLTVEGNLLDGFYAHASCD